MIGPVNAVVVLVALLGALALRQRRRSTAEPVHPADDGVEGAPVP
jgi:MYXO-CTERM domain-containing protein